MKTYIVSSKPKELPTWMSRTGSYNLLINRGLIGVTTHFLTFDPNFLGHPSKSFFKNIQGGPRKTN